MGQHRPALPRSAELLAPETAARVWHQGAFDPASRFSWPYLTEWSGDIVASLKRFSHSVDGETLPHARCRHCHDQIVEAPDIGWLDPTPGDTYDLCPSSPYGDDGARTACSTA